MVISSSLSHAFKLSLFKIPACYSFSLSRSFVPKAKKKFANSVQLKITCSSTAITSWLLFFSIHITSLFCPPVLVHIDFASHLSLLSDYLKFSSDYSHAVVRGTNSARGMRSASELRDLMDTLQRKKVALENSLRANGNANPSYFSMTQVSHHLISGYYLSTLNFESCVD